MGLVSNMFAGQPGPSQQTKSQVPSIESLGTIQPESLVVDEPMTEEQLLRVLMSSFQCNTCTGLTISPLAILCSWIYDNPDDLENRAFNGE